MFQPGIADLGAAEVEFPELREAPELRQPGVGDLGPAEESSALELGQALEPLQPGVGHVGAVEVQRFEPGQSPQAVEPGVGNPGVAEHQHFEPGQPSEAFQPGVAKAGPVEVQPLELGESPDRVHLRVTEFRAVLNLDPRHGRKEVVAHQLAQPRRLWRRGRGHRTAAGIELIIIKHPPAGVGDFLGQLPLFPRLGRPTAGDGDDDHQQEQRRGC